MEEEMLNKYNVNIHDKANYYTVQFYLYWKLQFIYVLQCNSADLAA